MVFADKVLAALVLGLPGIFNLIVTTYVATQFAPTTSDLQEASATFTNTSGNNSGGLGWAATDSALVIPASRACEPLVAVFLFVDAAVTGLHSVLVLGSLVINAGYVAAIMYFTIQYDTPYWSEDDPDLACEQSVPSYLYFELAVAWSEVVPILVRHTAAAVAALFTVDFDWYKFSQLPLGSTFVISALFKV
ncbi:hypothetical protein HK405_012080 [Cladochytrium tenue]|nr:hypothetical protein HK405_012080 [Cladochytrium tenue]